MSSASRRKLCELLADNSHNCGGSRWHAIILLYLPYHPAGHAQEIPLPSIYMYIICSLLVYVQHQLAIGQISNMCISVLTLVALAFSAIAIACTADLTWKLTNNEAALCNDFTRAGFFHRKPSSGDQKWVVFLESGALCYSNETCNRRYFQSYLRERYSTERQNIFGNFDTELAWNETGATGQPLTQVVNPLMTSTICFKSEDRHIIDANEFGVDGKDMLSSDCRENPAFCEHGHVLVPYCSSDLWLGNEDATSRDYPSLLQQEPCDCLDQSCFRYNPTSEGLQFTFRGQTIFRSVLQTLDTMYDLQSSSEIVLVGSSAGGLGVLNSAKWVRNQFPNVTIKVVIDSSWFINFRDGIHEIFGTTLRKSSGKSHINALIHILDSNEACSDITLGYPCCLSARCLLHGRSRTGEHYFPRDISVFVLQSLYDIFILANALKHFNPLDVQAYDSMSFLLKFIVVIGEYGGAMNSSLMETNLVSNLRVSYYATQCFQHVYFATSTLRGDNTLLGSEPIPHFMTMR